MGRLFLDNRSRQRDRRVKMNQNTHRITGSRDERMEFGYVVRFDSNILTPYRSQALRNHSPDGFNWGYGGSGPAQLALALLLAADIADDIALRLYQDFKWEYVSH